MYRHKDSPGLQLNTSSYISHPSVKLSDHRPVSLCLTAKVATEKDWERKRREQPRLPPFNPIVRFEEQQDWSVGSDCTAQYQVVRDAAYLKAWDWVGLFKVSKMEKLSLATML